MFGIDFVSIIAGLPGLVIALSIHEYAHARMAVAMGDFTPRMQGRLTLNPMAHIDPLGLVMLFFVRFGWAKPVIINPYNFRDMRKGNILVALAGPAANIIVGFFALAIVFLCTYVLQIPMSNGMRMVFSLIWLYNVNFAVFNLIPIPPLDGSKVLMEYLPPDLQYRYESLQRYGFIIMMIMLMTPILHMVLTPMVNLVNQIYLVLLHIVFAPFL